MAAADPGICAMSAEPRTLPTLSVSIVLHESAVALLERCLRCLRRAVARAQQRGQLGATRLVVLDNASSPAYRQQLRALHRTFSAGADRRICQRLVLHPQNLGFGAGHNAAQRGDRSDYVLILNPDAELEAESIAVALQRLPALADVVAINPYCVGEDGGPGYLCKRYPSLFDLYLRGFATRRLRQRHTRRLARYEYRDRDGAAEQPVDLLSGACLLTRGASFRAVGGFDARFFLYFEDFDLSLRLARHGRLLYLPSMVVKHAGGGAAAKGWRHRLWFLRSALRFFRRHGWRLR